MDDDRRRSAEQLVREVFSPGLAEDINAARPEGTFGVGIYDLAVDHVFGDLWLRPGLDRRARSLVTLGILIGSRAYDELEIHAVAAIRNGVTVTEVEEVIYHATGYAGFPAANGAWRHIRDAFSREGLIDEGGHRN